MASRAGQVAAALRGWGRGAAGVLLKDEFHVVDVLYWR